MGKTEDGEIIKEYVDAHEKEYSAINSVASRVLSLLLDLDIYEQTFNSCF